MKRSAKVWLKGAIAALIGGAAGSVSTALANVAVSPEAFNMGSGLLLTLKTAAVSAAISGVLSLSMYLKQSPVPPDDRSDLVGDLR